MAHNYSAYSGEVSAAALPGVLPAGSVNYSAFSSEVSAAPTAPASPGGGPSGSPGPSGGGTVGASARLLNVSQPDVPHLAWPPRVISTPDGGWVYEAVEQDSPDHLEDRVQVAARTLIGDRLEDPEFGVPDDLLRSPGVDLDAFKLHLKASEPDAAEAIDRITTPADIRSDVLRVLILEET